MNVQPSMPLFCTTVNDIQQQLQPLQPFIIGQRCLGVWTAHDRETGEFWEDATMILQFEQAMIAITANKMDELAIEHTSMDVTKPYHWCGSTELPLEYIFSPFVDTPIIESVCILLWQGFLQGIACTHEDGYMAVVNAGDACALRLAGIENSYTWMPSV